MSAFNLRLAPELDAQARARAAAIGISLNAFVAVCIDAYLRGSAGNPAALARPFGPVREPAGGGSGNLEPLAGHGVGPDDEVRRDPGLQRRPGETGKQYKRRLAAARKGSI